MGNLAVAFPKQFDNCLPPVTQLVGGGEEGGIESEDDTVGNMVAARISKRVGWPIFVSCNLSGADEEMVRIALGKAERGVVDYLLGLKENE